MSWADQWYRSMAEHNTGKCDKVTCRHCIREKATKERQDKAIAQAYQLCLDLKHTDVAKVVASYNGGSDESFVDYFNYYDRNNNQIKAIYVGDTDKEEASWQLWSNEMEEVAWGVLGHGFGNGDFSISGTIVLNVVENALYNNRELVANLKGAA
jgi:hypothetical protein